MIRERMNSDLLACAEILEQTHESDRYPLIWPNDVSQWIARSNEVNAWIFIDSESGSDGEAQSGSDGDVQSGSDREAQVLGHVALHAIDDGEVGDLWRSALGLEASQLGSIARLFVSPAARGRHIGRTLLRHAVSVAHEKGLQPVLDVAVNNMTAQSLYKAEGWQQVGTHTIRGNHPDVDVLLFSHSGGIDSRSQR